MIRQFRPEDAVQCCNLVRECLAEDSDLPTVLREKLVRMETPDTMKERAQLFFIAVFESESKILGIAGLDLNEIRLLCVSPSSRRQGIGRALLEHLKNMVPETLFSDVFVYSSIRGMPFYRACGFVERGPAILAFNSEQIRASFMTLQLRNH